MKREVPEMKSIAPFITDGERSEISTGTPGLHAAIFRKGSERLLTVANTTRKPQSGIKINVMVPVGAIMTPFLPGRGASLTWKDNAAQGSLPAEAAELYVLRPVPSAVDAGAGTDAGTIGGAGGNGSGGAGNEATSDTNGGETGSGGAPVPTEPEMLSDSGCGCTIGTQSQASAAHSLAWGVALLTIAARRRRRAQRSR